MKGDHVSLFSGVGMLDYAAEKAGFDTMVTAEIEPFCRSILKLRFPGAVHFEDVRDVTLGNLTAAGCVPTRPLLVSGGFPCQDIGDSGTGLGLAGARSGLVREQLRVIRELQPDYALFENSSLLTSRGLNVILHELDALGYFARWECIPAAAFGAPHLRDRCWIMARRYAFSALVHDDSLSAFNLRNAYVYHTRLPRAGVLHSGMAYATVPLWTRRQARLNAEDLHGSKLYPTPTKSDGTGGPGTTPKRTGGKNLRTVVAEAHGNGRLNPLFVEWMMGVPLDWTNPCIHDDSDEFEPPIDWRDKVRASMLPRTTDGERHRGRRIQALGNGCVPAVAEAALEILTAY